MTPQGPLLTWLGQAGFLLDFGDRVVLIDPYLSDSLAEKYRGQRFAHQRMLAAPITAEALARVDLVLCTHRHGDHMDPGTLPVIATRHRDCRFVVPAAERRHAQALGLPEPDWCRRLRARRWICSALRSCRSRRRMRPWRPTRPAGIAFSVTASPGAAARFIIAAIASPYPGLVGASRPSARASALLPVNGRDAGRAQAGIPGNFTLDEAASLCREAGIPVMLAHHWGMFDSHCDPAAIAALAAVTDAPRIILPQPGVQLRIGSDG